MIIMIMINMIIIMFRCIQGANILVATPGRLLDFLEGGQVIYLHGGSCINEAVH